MATFALVAKTAAELYLKYQNTGTTLIKLNIIQNRGVSFLFSIV